jgi:hypothetical protein
MVGIPMTGVLRAEWAMARWHQIIPCNWAQTDCIQWLSTTAPLGFLVADARNVVIKNVVEQGFEWLFFIDHDVILPPLTVIKMNDRMLKGDVPVWSGLYFTKSVPSEPIIYRGRGTSYYNKWKMGDEVWCDGIPMGCTMIHSSILKVMWNESEEYQVAGQITRKVFESPRATWYDPETKSWLNSAGTEDLNWCMRVINDKIFERAGWPKYQKKKWPFLIDTNIFCKHIDFDGNQYPATGEEREFERKK